MKHAKYMVLVGLVFLIGAIPIGKPVRLTCVLGAASAQHSYGSGKISATCTSDGNQVAITLPANTPYKANGRIAVMQQKRYLLGHSYRYLSYVED